MQQFKYYRGTILRKYFTDALSLIYIYITEDKKYSMSSDYIRVDHV
jgi:hypothetical protein